MDVYEKINALMIIDKARNVNKTLLHNLVLEYEYKVACEILTQHCLQEACENSKTYATKTKYTYNIDAVTELWQLKAINFVIEATINNERVSADDVLEFLKSENLIPKQISDVGMKLKIGKFFKKAGVQNYRFWYKSTNQIVYWVE